MNLSYRWLRELMPGVTDSPERLAERLAMYGAPVDELLPLGRELGDIVVARVAAVKPHPNADRLSLCEVDAGTGEILSVVCGAPNVEADRFYPFAPVGAALPGGTKIRKAKIRGEVSEGMLCSERELGLGRAHEGIMALGGRHTPGRSLVDALGLDDWRIVIDVTPNRPDLLSHWGVARELAPGGQAALELPPFPDSERPGLEPVELARGDAQARVASVEVRLEAPELCPRYLGAVIRGVRVGPSPDWLAGRLRALGLRPINNVVDATNYVLHELGQPLHAFDLDRLRDRRIVVRRAREGERLRTLDGVERTLRDAMLVIADAQHAVAVAGVMGGEESEVSAETRAVLLECARFDPASVRATRRALGLSTDASYRFERGVDPEGMERALRRAAALIAAVAGGTVESPVADARAAEWQAPRVPLRPGRASHVLGVDFDAASVRALLEPLGFEPLDGDDDRADDAVVFRVPGHRAFDVAREVDLIEEVARRHGYEAFPDALRPFRPTTVPDDPMERLEDELRSLLVARGFLEARTAPFAPASEGEVELMLPLSSEESRLRADLLAGLVHRLEHNFARGVRDARLFEIGTAFAARPGADRPAESTRLAAIFTGARAPRHWSGEAGAYDVWDVKGLLEELADALGLAGATVGPAESRVSGCLDPAHAVELRTGGGERIGYAGHVRDAAIDAPPWAGVILGLELVLDRRLAAPRERRYRALPEHPASERDLALLVPAELAAAHVGERIRAEAGPLLRAAEPFDVYRGPGIPEDRRSIAFRLTFQAPDRTLTDEEVDRAVQHILTTLEEELGVERR